MYLERRDREESLYDRLQQDSLEMVQALCGHVWSDYNAHDPGVTILDILNYALLETDYRFGFPLSEYLTQGPERPNPERMGLFPASVLSTGSVVTPADYERHIIGQLTEVQRCRVTLDENNLYRIEIQSEPECDRDRLRRRIERLYHACRNLGEDLGEITFCTLPVQVVPELVSPFGEEVPLDMTPSVVAGASHRPLRFDFPDCYGVNENGADPPDSGHQARIRQLKAYLHLFDRLLEDTLRQTKDIPKLFTLSEQLPAADPANPTATDQNIRTEAAVAAEEPAFTQVQRAAYLDMLDTLYGEDTGNLFSQAPADLPQSNRKRVRAIRQLVRLNAIRSRGFDQSDTSSVPVVRKIMALLSGFRSGKEMPLADLLGHFTSGTLSDEFRFRDRIPQLPENDDFDAEREGETIEVVPVKAGLQGLRRIAEKLSVLRDSLIFEGFLARGANIDRYRCVAGRRGGYRLTFCYSEEVEEGRWIGLGRFAGKAELTETANLLRQVSRRLRERASAFYLLEHILLRTGQTSPDSGEDLKITVVLPCWIESAHRRRAYEEQLRKRLPAHLEPDFLWLHLDDMISFEVCYFRWRRTLASRDDSGRRRWADTLKRFVSHHASKP